MHTKSAGIISLLNVKEYFHSECSEVVHCNKRDILQCLQFFHTHLLGSWICFCCKAYGRKVSYSTGLIRRLYEFSDPVHTPSLEGYTSSVTRYTHLPFVLMMEQSQY